MLVIRTAQMDVFQRDREETFREDLVLHSQSFAPELCRVAGEDNVRATIERGLATARGYGFTLRGPLRFFIELMLSFGSSMDDDPLLPWISEELTNQRAHELTRAGRLYRRMTQFFDTVMGPSNEYALAALLRATMAEPDEYDRHTGEPDDRIDQILTTAFPQKKEYAGVAGTRALVAEAHSICAPLGIVREQHVAFVVVLMFAFGHGVIDDLLYPWAGHTLRDGSIGSMAERVRRLQRRTRTYAERAYRNLAPTP